MLEEIVKLNKRIDNLMREKTRADGQRELWVSQLSENLNKYKETYGVDLSSEDINQLKQNIKNETEKVHARVTEEYEKYSKIVSLVENGDMVGASKLLGVYQESVAGEVQEEVREEVQEEVREEIREEVGKVREEVREVQTSTPQESQMVGGTFDLEDLDDEDFYGSAQSSNPYVLDDEDEEPQPQSKQEKQEEKKPQHTTYILDDDDEEDFQPKQEEKKPQTAYILDDEDDEDDFGGFGNILQGSKFKV